MTPRSNEATKRWTRRAAVALAGALGAALIAPAADAATPQILPICSVGYVYLNPAVGPALQVCASQRENFSPPLRDVTVSNLSTISVCVEVIPGGYAGLVSGESLHAADVYGLMPGQACPV